MTIESELAVNSLEDRLYVVNDKERLEIIERVKGIIKDLLSTQTEHNKC